MNIIQLLLTVFWFFMIPTACGGIFLGSSDSSVGESFFAGWMFLLALGEVLTLPLIALSAPLHILVFLFGSAACAVGCIGFYKLRRQKHIFTVSAGRGRLAGIWLIAAIIVIAAQIYLAARYTIFNADDSFYVGTASTAVYTDTIFSINPYTGAPHTELYSRYVLSPYPVFLAVLSRLCGGIDPAVMAHIIYPCVFFILAYVILFLTGRALLHDDDAMAAKFTLTAAVIISYSAFSIYNRENFQMIRIWQGKAMMAAVIIPAAFLLGLCRTIRQDETYSPLIVLMTCTAGCLTTTLGIAALPICLGSFALIRSAKSRSFHPLLECIAEILPCLIIGIIYILIR